MGSENRSAEFKEESYDGLSPFPIITHSHTVSAFGVKLAKPSKRLFVKQTFGEEFCNSNIYIQRLALVTLTAEDDE